MLVSTQLLTTVQSSSKTFSSDKIAIPPEWNSWFAMKKPTTVAFVQDMVYVAVKLKTRLLKPSIVLPFGNYVAGVHHLRIVQQNFGKDQHGLRERDINYKDKQNYDAVERMISESVKNLLASIPDAKGTTIYLSIMKSINDSFLDKTLECLSRVEKAWYAVFVLRYWRQWIVRHSNYNLANNFITSNTYMCIELNAHSLLIHILSLQNLLPPTSENFLSWLLGSQCCERLFRSARSMSSTFSTVINFGILGLTRRLHRLQLQIKLESECNVTEIKYPRARAQESQCKPSICKPHLVTVQDITRTVEKALEKAKGTMQDLGMADLLKEHEDWNNPPIPGHGVYVEDDQDDDDDGEVASDNVADLLEVNSTVEPNEVSAGITQLSDADLIDEKMADHLKSLHNASFRKISNNGLPVYEIEADSSTSKSNKCKFCSFVEVNHNNKKVFIHKTTAVWLLQEGERLSTDRLFRVRAKQPFSTDNVRSKTTPVSTEHPTVCSTVEIGSVCAFKCNAIIWKIGRLLQFAHHLEKKKSSQQYRGRIANVDHQKLGVLCSWFTSCVDLPRKFSLVTETNHKYVPLSTYLCTLSEGCFELSDVQLSTEGPSRSLVTSDHLILSEMAMCKIQNIFQDSVSDTLAQSKGAISKSSTSIPSSIPVISITDESVPDNCNYWTKCGRVLLTKKDKQCIVNGKELSDLHINAFQSIARREFPQVGGLHNTLVLHKMSLTDEEGFEQFIQILHIKERSHWATLQIVGTEIQLYDSLFTSASDETVQLIAQLVKTKNNSIDINAMNIQKQAGTVDCAIYAIATATSLLLGHDPTSVVLNQKEIRLHLVKLLEANTLSLFPVVKNRRPAQRIIKTQRCFVFCRCRLPDSGEKMVSCDKCQEWFHLSCLNIETPSTESWFCDNCTNSNCT